MILLIITLFMFMLAAAYWAYCFADIIGRVQILIQDPENYQASSPVTRWLALFNAVVLVNYLLNDGIVVWRARLICSPDHRKYLYFPILVIVFAFVAVTALIGLRIAAAARFTLAQSTLFLNVINTLQMLMWAMSLISNISATGIVGITAWRHRQTIRGAFHKPTQGNQILLFLLESGVLYCISGAFLIVSSLIRVPYSTLGDYWNPLNIQLAGAYTPIVLLLVSTQKSLSEPSFLGTIPDASDVSHSPIRISVAAAVSSHGGSASAETYMDGMLKMEKAIGLIDPKGSSSRV